MAVINSNSTNSRRNSDKTSQHVSINMAEQSGTGDRFGEGFDEKRRLTFGEDSTNKCDRETKDDKDEKPTPVPFLGIDLQHYSKATQFCVLSFGIFFFYLLYGIAMEQIFRYPGLKPHGWYLTLVQFGIYAIISKLEMMKQNQKTRQIPLSIYAILALVQLGTIGFSNASLQYLNYPTQVIFKSCKLIPVLIGGILIQRKRKGLLDFVAAIVMSFGLAIFLLADSQVSPNFNAIGVIMISTALVADAIIGNLQEKVMKNYPSAVNAEFIHYSYAIGFLYLFVCMILTGNLKTGFDAFAEEKLTISYGITLVYSITGYLGVQVVLTMVRQFGAFTAVAVTSMRKALSIVISFILFSKPFTPNYVYGGLIVLLGIYLNLVAKDKKNADIVCKAVEKVSNICPSIKNQRKLKTDAEKRIPVVI